MEETTPSAAPIHRLQNLIQQVKELKIHYLSLQDENRWLKIQIEEKDKEIERLKKLNHNLENQITIQNLVTQKEYSESQREHIEALLKEIEDCLGLLETCEDGEKS